MHESTCSKDYALKPPGLKSDSLIRRRREATPRPRPRPGAGRGEPGSRRKPGGWGSPSWSELDTDIHMVLKKGWPGTLPETSPVTCPWPRDQILHALPEAHPLAMGRWGAAARPGGRKCTHTPRQRIKCSPAGISAPPPPPRRPNPAAWPHLTKTLRLTGPGSWALPRGVLGPQDSKGLGRSFPWPVQPALNTWPIVSTTGCHPQWAWRRVGRGRGLQGEACGEHGPWGGGHPKGSRAVHGPGAGDAGVKTTARGRLWGGPAPSH